MQKDDVAFPFLDRDGGVFNAGQLVGQSGQFVVVGRKQRAAPVAVVQMFEGGPGDGQAIIGRRTAPDFIEDHQRVFVGLIQDRRRFDHLDHKGRPPPGQIVGCPHAAEQLADHT